MRGSNLHLHARLGLLRVPITPPASVLASVLPAGVLVETLLVVGDVSERPDDVSQLKQNQMQLQTVNGDIDHWQILVCDEDTHTSVV